MSSNSLSKAIVFMSVVLSVSSVLADPYTWTGLGGDNNFNNDANWSPNTGHPGTGCSATFDIGEGNELSLTGSFIVQAMYVQSGKVTIDGGTGYHYMHGDGKISVAEGAELVLLGDRLSAYNKIRPFDKLGGGTLRCLCTLGANVEEFHTINLKEGMIVLDANSAATNFVVSAGATLDVDASGKFGSRPVISVAEGGEVRFGNSAVIYISGVCGSGLVRGGGQGAVACTLAKGPLTFAGTTADMPSLVFINRDSMSAADFSWTVANPTALENAAVADAGALRFDVDVPEITIGCLTGNRATADAWLTKLPTQTVSGDPLKVSFGKLDVIPSTSGVELKGGTWSGSIVNTTTPGVLRIEGSNAFENVEMSSDATVKLAADAVLTQDGGTIAGTTEKNSQVSVVDVRLPLGVQFDDAAHSGTFRLESGEAHVNGGNGYLPKRIEVTGGALTMVKTAWYGKYSSVQSPSELYVDGGRVDISCRWGATTGKPRPYNFFRDDYAARVFVGAAGATFAAVNTVYNDFGVDNVGYNEQFLNVNKPIEPTVGVTAGPLTFRGWVKWNYNQPGKKLTYAGASDLMLRHAATDGANAIEIGALERAGKGSALFVDDIKLTVGADGASSVKVAGGLETNRWGYVAAPIYGDRADNCDPLPFKYDDEKGLVATTTSDFTPFSSSTGDYDNYVWVENSVYPNVQTYVMPGLLVKSKMGANNDNTVYRIGDGVHPAYVGLGSYPRPFERGTIDFGTSEGVFVTRWISGGDVSHDIGAVVDGQNGVSFVAGAQELAAAAFTLSRANTYKGGTFVSGCHVLAAAEGCLSDGDVTVNGSELAGGSIWFVAPGTYANNFTVGGFGRRKEKYNADPFGALVFREDVTITGDVVLTEPTRVSVDTNLDSRITGTVSGDRLSVYSFKSGRTGVLELAGHNTYAGGTEILQQSVAIREADGFGTGPVRVEKGVLVFRNPSAITVPNAMSGHDVTLRYDGAGAVTLANAADLGVTRVEVTPGEHAFTALPTVRPLVSTAERPRQRAILVLKAGGTYALTQADLEGYFEIVLEDGATLDLGGGELTVFRFTGKLSDVNGTIVETNPKRGSVLIFR